LIALLFRSFVSRLASAHSAEARRSFAILQLTLKLSITLPRPGDLPGDVGVFDHFHQPRATAGPMPLKTRVKIIGKSQAMTGVLVGFSKMYEVDRRHRRNSYASAT
jgi:hypothetical protein